MVQLEVLVAVARHDREATVPVESELVAHAVGEAEHAVGVFAERGVVGAVVETHTGCPSVDGGKEQSREHQLFHERSFAWRGAPHVPRALGSSVALGVQVCRAEGPRPNRRAAR